MPHLVVDVESLVNIFGHWDMLACVLNTASFGDVIASFRLVIIGKFVTNIPTPKLSLSPVVSEHTSTIHPYIGSLVNGD